MNAELPPLKKPERSKLRPLKNGGSAGPVLAGLAIAIVGLAAAAAVLFLLLSKPEPEVPSIPFDADNRGSAKNVNRSSTTVQSSPAGRAAPVLPRLVQYPSTYWTAKLPTGNEWSRPEATDLGGLDRTELGGPDDSIVIIDYTPSERPNPANVISRQPAYIGANADAEQVRIQGGDICPQGTICTDYLLPSGAGGYAVLVGWPGREATAAKLAKAIANSLVPNSGGFD